MKRIQSFVAVVLFCILPTLFTIQVKAQYPQSNQEPYAHALASEIINSFQQPAVTFDQSVVEEESQLEQAAQPGEGTIVEAPGSEIEVNATAEPVEFMQEEAASADSVVDQAQQQTNSSDQEQLSPEAQKEFKEMQDRIAQIRKEAAEKAAQKVLDGAKKEAEKNPSIFLRQPTEEFTKHLQEDGLTVDVNTRLEKFQIKAPENGESHLPVEIMEMGIRDAVRGPRSLDFAGEFRLAKNRSGQEQVLRRFVPEVANFKAPEKRIEPEEISCSADTSVAPSDFPQEKSLIRVIPHFGTNSEHRMGNPVTNKEEFIAGLPNVEKAINERLPKFMSFVDRAYVAHVLHTIALTKSIDGRIAKEDWGRNYPWRRHSTGSGTPLDFVHFVPNAEGMQERGLFIPSPYTGKAYFINYVCGLNLDEVGGCVAIAMGVYHTDVLSVDCYEVRGEPKQFTSEQQTGQYEAVIGIGKDRTEINKDLMEIRGSKWVLENPNDRKVLATDIPKVSVNAPMIVPEVRNSLTYTGEVRVIGVGDKWYPMSCSTDLTKLLPPPLNFPSMRCDTLRAWKKGKRILASITVDNPDNMQYTVVLMLDGAIQKTTLEKDGTYFFLNSISDKDTNPHYVTAEIRDANGQLFRNEKGESVTIGCSDHNQNNLIQNPPPPPVPCKCKSLKADNTKLNPRGGQQITITPTVPGDRSTIKSAIWTKEDGSLIDLKYVNPETLQLHFLDRQLLPTENHKGQTRLKTGGTTFVLTVTDKDGTVTVCKVTVKVSGAKIWPWLLLVAIVFAVVVIIIITHGAAAPMATKIAIPVTGV
jgi:hypothetical protein